MAPIFGYLVAALLFPPPGEDRPVDLRDFCYENQAWIFGAWAGFALVNAGFYGDIINQPLELATLVDRYLPVLLLGAQLAMMDTTSSFGRGCDIVGPTTNRVYGQTYNTYDLSRAPSGSSGGAAAIIASAG